LHQNCERFPRNFLIFAITVAQGDGTLRERKGRHAITVLCIATLFITMQITTRLDWDAVFQKGRPGPKADKIQIPEPETVS